jgi:hypothetical protein
MKSTNFCLLSLLIVVNSTFLKNEMPTGLLQISKNSKAEAIFATMAIQMKADEVGAFDRISALLNDLVNDAQDQLHEIKLTYRKAQSNCDVQKGTLESKQVYIENMGKRAGDRLDSANEVVSVIKESQSGRKALVDFLTSYGARNAERLGNLEAALSARALGAGKALDKINNAVNQINAWNTEKVQNAVNEVSNAAAGLTDANTNVAASFVQLAASDNQVKARLLEWLAELERDLNVIKTLAEEGANRTRDNADASSKAVANIQNFVSEGDKLVTQDLANFEALRDSSKEAQSDAQKLAGENSALLASTEEWCSTEKSNYKDVKAQVEEEIELFQDVRSYWHKHYSEIDAFIRNKYNSH